MKKIRPLQQANAVLFLIIKGERYHHLNLVYFMRKNKIVRHFRKGCWILTLVP